jgi:hypothetical protein
MKLEEEYGFEAALEMDDRVWRVFPKIQARMLKSFGGLGEGLADLEKALATRLVLEEFRFSTERNDQAGELLVTIHHCPWQEMLARAGRASLGDRIGKRICQSEYTVWAAEFGAGLRFELGERRCGGGECCRLRFHLGGET